MSQVEWREFASDYWQVWAAGLRLARRPQPPICPERRPSCARPPARPPATRPRRGGLKNLPELIRRISFKKRSLEDELAEVGGHDFSP